MTAEIQTDFWSLLDPHSRHLPSPALPLPFKGCRELSSSSPSSPPLSAELGCRAGGSTCGGGRRFSRRVRVQTLVRRVSSVLPPQPKRHQNTEKLEEVWRSDRVFISTPQREDPEQRGHGVSTVMRQ